MFCIYQPPNADFGDFAKQRNGGGSREKAEEARNRRMAYVSEFSTFTYQI
jgi:hypothetical protein